MNSAQFTSANLDVKLAVPAGFNIDIWRSLIRKWRHAQVTAHKIQVLVKPLDVMNYSLIANSRSLTDEHNNNNNTQP
jgi:hypothetical protein